MAFDFDEEMGLTKQQPQQTQSQPQSRSGFDFDEEMGIKQPEQQVAKQPIAQPQPNITQQVINPGIQKPNGKGYAVKPSVNEVPNNTPVYADNGVIQGEINRSDYDDIASYTKALNFNRTYNERFGDQDRNSLLADYNEEHRKNGTNKGLPYRLGQTKRLVGDTGLFFRNAWRDGTEVLGALGSVAPSLLKGAVNAVLHPVNSAKGTAKNLVSFGKSIGNDIGGTVNNIANVATGKLPVNKFFKAQRELEYQDHPTLMAMKKGFIEGTKDVYGQKGVNVLSNPLNGEHKFLPAIDTTGFIQSFWAHPLNLLDLHGFSQAAKAARMAKPYMKNAPRDLLDVAKDKAYNATIGTLDKVTSANPNIADKVAKAADSFGYDASKLNENTAKMHEFNKLVEEGKTPKYSELQEKAIEHSKLANEEQSKKLIDELTHGVEETKAETKTNIPSEHVEKPLTHVEEDLGKNIPEQPKTPQNEPTNHVSGTDNLNKVDENVKTDNNTNTNVDNNKPVQPEKTPEQVERQSHLNWGKTLEKHQKKQVVTDEAGNIVYEYRDGRRFPKREDIPYSQEDTSRLLRGGFNGHAKNPQKFYDKMINKINEVAKNEPELRQKMIDQLNHAAERFENTKMADGKKVNKITKEDYKLSNIKQPFDKGNLNEKKIADALFNGNNNISNLGKKTKYENVIQHCKDLDEDIKTMFLSANKDFDIILTNEKELGDANGLFLPQNKEHKYSINDANIKTFYHESGHGVWEYLSKTDKNVAQIHNNCIETNKELALVKKQHTDIYNDFMENKNLSQYNQEDVKRVTKAVLNYFVDIEETYNNMIGSSIKATPQEFIQYSQSLHNEIVDRLMNERYNKPSDIVGGFYRGTYERLPEQYKLNNITKTNKQDGGWYVNSRNNGNAKRTTNGRNQKGVQHSGTIPSKSRTNEQSKLSQKQIPEHISGVPEQPKTVADSKPVEHNTVTKDDLKDVDFGKSYNGINARKYVAKTSKDTENILIELGLLDTEQAANRLKQQSAKTGKDKAYFRGYKKAKEGINIEKDYNATAKNRPGLFWKKTKDGIHETGSAEDVTRSEINRNIHAHYTKNTTDYVANNFALPIENGKIKDGYVGVNRVLLNHMVHGRLSSEWYKTMNAGEEAIRKAFRKNEGVANTWVDIAKKNSNYDYQIPKAVFDTLADGSAENAAIYWERYARPDNMRGVVKGVGKYAKAVNEALLNGFKRRVLATGSFVLNNRIGNQIMLYMHSDNAIDYLKSIYKAGTLKDADIPAEIIQSNIAEAAKDALVRKTYTGHNGIDNAINLFNGQLIDTKELKGMKKASATTANDVIGLPNKAFNKVSETVMKFNDKFEKFERKQRYAQMIDKERMKLVKQTGQNLVKDSEVIKHIKADSEITEAVIREIEDTLGNYRSFNKFEKNVLRQIVPFYSWYRTITRHTLKLATKHPERVAKVRLELRAIGIDGKGHNDQKEYQRYATPTGYKDSRSGKETLINKEHAMPYNTFREDIGWNPYLQRAGEAIRGKKYFRNSEITNDRYTKQTYYEKGRGSNPI